MTMKTIEKGRWMVELYHQWDSFTRRVNWRDFTFICIEGEWNHSWPLVEFRVVLLGLGLRVVRQLDPGEDDEGKDCICNGFIKDPDCPEHGTVPALSVREVKDNG